MARRNRKPYKFQSVKHSADGFVSVGLEILSILLFGIELVLTVHARGQAGGIAGLLGVAALLFSIMGFVFAVISWKDEEAADTSKRVGTLLGIIVVLVNLILLILGIAG
jgi:hypothetical protein